MRLGRIISLCLITVIVGALELAAQNPARTSRLPAFDEGLVRLDVAGIGAWDMGAGFVEDSLYLPFGVLAMPLNLKLSNSADHDTIATEFPLGTPIRFVRSTNTCIKRDSSLALPEGAIREYDGEYYIRYDVLLGALGMQGLYNLRALKLSIPYDIRIPAVANAINKGRYEDLKSRTTTDRKSDLPTPPKGVLLGSALVQWSAVGSYGGSAFQGGTGMATVTGPLLYGTATLGGNARQRGGVDNSLDYRFSHAAWSLPILDFTPLSRILVSVRPQDDSDPDFSITIANPRLTRPKQVETRDLSGITMPGWDVELYDGSQLVDVTRADSSGRYSFTLPVGYGKVRRVVNEVGPHGERIVSEHTIGLAAGSLFPGEVQYQADLGREHDGTEPRYNGALAVRTGVFDWLNVGATADLQTMRLDRAMLDSIHIQPAMNIWIGNTAVVELQGSPTQKTASGELTLGLGPSIGASLSAQSSFATKSYSVFGTLGLPIGPVSFTSTGGYIETPASIGYSFAPRFGAGFGRLSLTSGASLSYARGLLTTNSGSQMSIVSDTRLMYRFAHWLGLSAGGRYDLTGSQLEEWNVATTTSFSGMNLGMVYSARGTDWRNGSLQAQLTVGLGIASSRTNVDYANDEMTGTSTLEGAFSISGAGVSAERVGSGSVPTLTIIGFADRNLNGQRDNGEETYSGIRARMSTIDGGSAMTKDGRFLMVRPYAESYIDIDPSSLADENLAPMKSEYVIIGIPSMRHVIEVPFASGYDVSGTCEVELPGGRRKTSSGVLNGLRIRLVSSNGKAVYNGETFFDGSMIIAGVAPGTYSMEFDGEQLSERRIMLKNEIGTVEINERTADLPAIIFIPDPSVN